MHSSIRNLFLAISASVFLFACGVDTTGLSAESTKQPRGNPSAIVSVLIYGDLQCPACATAHELIDKPLFEQYSQQVRFEFRQMPLQTIHPFALRAAMASECAADQGKFWEYLDVAYENQPDLSPDALGEWAAGLGLDTALFDRCLASGIKRKAVLADADEAQQLGINGTPTYVVNGIITAPNSVEIIKSAIDTALAQAENMPL